VAIVGRRLMSGVDVHVTDRSETPLKGGRSDPALRLDRDVGCDRGRFGWHGGKSMVATPGLE
jgi:hypothetical protein